MNVVVDVGNSPSFEEQAVLQFFSMSTANLLAAEQAAGVVSQAPRHAGVEVGGPQRLPMSTAVQLALDAKGDARRVVADAQAPYFGSVLDDRALVTASDAAIGATTLDAWLASVR